MIASIILHHILKYLGPSSCGHGSQARVFLCNQVGHCSCYGLFVVCLGAATGPLAVAVVTAT